MKKRMFVFLIVIMSISLVGIIFVQVYWIKKTVNAEEAQFSFNARQSLLTVANQVENREINQLYTKFTEASDSINTPNQRILSRLFHVEKNDLNNETYFISNGILQEDYKLRFDMPGFNQDSIDFKKIVNRKLTLVRKDDLNKEIGLSAQEKFERVSRLKEREKALLSEAVKNFTDKLPIYERITQSDLKRLINRQLSLRGIHSDYDFGIFSGNLATKVMSANFDRLSPSSYGISIFPSDQTNYKLYINFTDKQSEIYYSVSKMATLSIVFTLVIVLAYGGAIFQLVRQRRISEIKTDFINNMTHEFKTPIATISVALDFMRNPKIFGNEKLMKDYLQKIKNENNRMHAQVENVLRISKLERNELNIEKHRVLLHEIIEKSVSHVELIVENRNGYVQTHFGALKSAILASESHFESVIVNILENAVKYSENEPKIDIFTENVRDLIVVKIRDQGKGMGKTAQKKIFNKFYREHTGDLHNVKGQGLGLAYVKTIVEDHQGEVSVESEKGKGSTFIIKLPLIS